MAAHQGADAPDTFLRAVASLRRAELRPEVVLAEAPAPQRLAPYAVAFTAEVVPPGGGDDLATGRLVLLHDPGGHEAWHGTLRLVTFVRADLEPELAADPLLAGVGWTWLVEALEQQGAEATAVSGTVTRVASESFGALADRPATAEVEVRASWTPLGEDLAPHLQGWVQLLCTAAGLPPLPAGVVPIPARRTARGR